MAEAGLQGNFRSPIGARLEGIESAYRRLEAERDQAIRERDEARAALQPLLEQVEGLRAAIMAHLPKGDTRLPSRRMKRINEETVADWAARNEGGESLSQIATRDGTHPDTVKKALLNAGIQPKMQGRKLGTPRCKECGLPFDSPALTQANVPPPRDGVCGLCQFIANDLAEKRKGAGK